MKKKKSEIFVSIFLFLLLIAALVYMSIKSFKLKKSIPIYSEEHSYVELPVELVSFTTNIYTKTKNRVHNIQTACSYLNEYVIMSGEEFSYNAVAGPYSKEKGYLVSTGFDNLGNVVKIMGGGVCQSSSTLYNVALMLDLKITERHAHSAPVGYVPEGKDATIAYGVDDLKFVNTMEYDIKITATCSEDQVTVSFYKL